MTTPTLQRVVGSPTTLPVGARPIQVCPAMKGPVLVYNNDLTNIVYIAYGPVQGPAPSNSIPIQPLTSASIDGSRGLFGFCPTATVNVTIIPGGTYLSPSPAQIAAQIALSGVGLLNKNSLMTLTGFPGGQSVAVGTPFTITLSGLTGTGYVGSMLLWAAANAFCTVNLLFQDSSGQTLSDVTWNIAPGSAIGTNHGLLLSGPATGTQIQVTITAFINTINFILSVFQNGLTYSRHDWRTVGQTATNNTGVIIPAVNVPSLEEFALPSTSFGIGLTNTYLLPLFAGRVRIWGFTGSNTSDMGMNLTSYADRAATAGNNQIWGTKSDATGNVNTEFSLPRTQCTLAITNNNAAAKNITAAITLEEY